MSTAAGWIKFSSEVEGQGPAELTFAIDPNRSTEARRSDLVVADQRVAISQKAATCTWKFTPDSMSVAPAGGEIHAVLATEDYCSWTLSPKVQWIEIAPAMRGVGPADISLRISKNAGPERSGSVEFPSGVIVVSQKEAPGAPASPEPVPPAPGPPVPIPPAPVPCVFQVSPREFNDVPNSASALQVDVTTQTGCAWSATSNVTWVTISSRTDAPGSGQVQLSVSENTGTARSGTLVIGGQTITVNQQSRTVVPPPPPPPGPCTFQVAPTEFNDVLYSGSQLQVDVTTQAGCAWSATSNATWVTVSATDATATGHVQLTVAENTGAARSGTLSIAGQTVTVNQQSRPAPPPPPPPACTFQLAPTEFNDVLFSGSTLQADVTTQAGCAWTAASNAPWVTITSGTNGTGSGRVELNVAENTGDTRSGTLVIATQTLTVNQQARPACAFTINPGSYNPSGAGGTVTVAVTTTSGCEWTVANNPAWVSATPTGGTGSGTTIISVQSNGGAARSATLKIAGRDFAVQQASAPCTYAAGPSTRTVPYTQSTREIGVVTQDHCPVSATENASWIQIVSAPTIGPGEITFRVDENKSRDPRSAPITISGQNYTYAVTVVQDGKP